jgi:hypothetical protein
MSEPVKICVIVEGGLVQAVMTGGVPVEVIVADYDVEGVDETRLLDFDGGGAAYVSRYMADDSPADRKAVALAFELVPA